MNFQKYISGSFHYLASIARNGKCKHVVHFNTSARKGYLSHMTLNVAVLYALCCLALGFNLVNKYLYIIDKKR